MGHAAAAAKSLQSCPTLCDPIDGSPPGSPVPGILQARTLEWVAISFSNAWKWKVKVKSFSCVRLLATPCTSFPIIIFASLLWTSKIKENEQEGPMISVCEEGNAWFQSFCFKGTLFWLNSLIMSSSWFHTASIFFHYGLINNHFIIFLFLVCFLHTSLYSFFKKALESPVSFKQSMSPPLRIWIYLFLGAASCSSHRLLFFYHI